MSSIAERVKAFPPLDDTIMQIQRICMDKDSSIKDLNNVVENDPMLTANILKASNSPLYGFSREIKNVTQAISLFGMATIRGFALSSAIKQNIEIDLSAYELSDKQFLNISSMQSAMMYNWYSKVNRKMLDILIPASFLMEIGKIIISLELKENGKTKEFIEALKNAKTPKDIPDTEIKFTGYSNEEITAKIFEQWSLEPEMVDAIKFSNNPENSEENVYQFATALQIVKTIINSSSQFDKNNIAAAIELLSKNDMDKEPFLNAIEIVNP